MRTASCPNNNHRRSNAPVRYCPSCGEVVNGAVNDKNCPTSEHDKARKEGNHFCVHCGLALRERSPGAR